MILEPSKSAQEIDRRLSTLNDPELIELLRAGNAGLLGIEDDDSYTSPSAPYWKRRVGLITLVGLLTMSAGYGYAVSVSHTSARPKTHAALVVPARHHPKHAAVHHAAPTHHAVVAHHAAVAPTHAAPAPAVVHPITLAAPNEALIREARAQLLHERALAAQARAETALAQHEAKVAMQARAAAKAQALAEALAQARAEARAQALARAQAQAQSVTQEELAQQQQQLLDNASDPQIKPGAAPPASTGRVSTNPNAGPLPMPGPNDPNCTPHRGSLFGAVLDHVRVGGTNVGGLLRIIHQ